MKFCGGQVGIQAQTKPLNPSDLVKRYAGVCEGVENGGGPL